MKAILILNCAISVLAVLLLPQTYGTLHWWYRGLIKAGVEPSVRGGFFETLDALPIIAIALTATSFTSTILVRRIDPKNGWTIPAIVFSAMALIICAFTRI